jgi:hypothetical protein
MILSQAFSYHSRFLKSANFRAWYSARRRTANKELARLFLVAVSEYEFTRGNVSSEIRQMELGTVDLILRIRDTRVCLSPPVPLHSVRENTQGTWILPR